MLCATLGCSTSSVERLTGKSAIWYDEFLITSEIDEEGKPVDSLTKIEYGIDKLICIMSIRGSNTFQLPVTWYYEDRLLSTTIIAFGERQRGEAFLLHDKPLPVGKYRCEWGAVESPVRILNVEIIESTPN